MAENIDINEKARAVRFQVYDRQEGYGILDTHNQRRRVAVCPTHADAANVCSALNRTEEWAGGSAALEALLAALDEGYEAEAIRAAARLIAALIPEADGPWAQLLNVAAKVEAHADGCIDW
jgi:hypothetical protein